MEKATKSLVWFRQDLRVSDNPALAAATKHGSIIPIYIFDDTQAQAFAMGGASKWWLHHSLNELNKSLKNKLNIYKGDPLKIIPKIIKKYTVSKAFWNQTYEPWRRKYDNKIIDNLTQLEIPCNILNGTLLWHPEDVLKNDGTPYKVYGAFYRKARAHKPSTPTAAPRNLVLIKDTYNKTTITSLKLLPSKAVCKKFENIWSVGEEAAKKQLTKFIRNSLSDYKLARDFPAHKKTSRLSPHLHFGEVSPQQIWDKVQKTKAPAQDKEHFFKELAWREFSSYLLYHFPTLPSKNFNESFNSFPWKTNNTKLKAWQEGKTGYPIIDAGMRELWQTGYMHNRVRMIVGSFLVKNLLIHWKHGRDWFWDCLLDADLANNSASWQWVAGSGADAAPYFRIFNPVTQGEKFDKQGEYTRKYVPELAQLPNKYLFKPWEAPQEVLASTAIKLGKDYPKPIVDLKESREKALAAYYQMKKKKKK